MAELSHKERTISTKIVYYGAAMSGKTTNIQVLHEHATASRRGELVSVNTAQDRTIMFDLLPIKVAAFRGLDLKVQLVAVPGQPMYAAIRRLALRDVDSLVFVADSAPDRQEENVASLKEMVANLAGRPGDAASFPMVLQYNKRDLPDAVPIAALDRALNPRQVISRPAVAIRGEGVLETFMSVLTVTVADLARRYRLADLGKGQTIDEWAAAAVQEIFGTTSFPSTPQATGSGQGRRVVRLSLPPDISGNEKLDARTNEALVESYAQAAAALGDSVQQLRDERDLAQRRLADVLELLDAAKTLKPGAPRDPLLAVVLSCLAQEVDSTHASLIVPLPNLGVRAAALHNLERDPILSHPEAMPRVRGFLQTTAARWHETDNDPALREILSSSQPSHGSVLTIPLTTGHEAIGVALLYRGPSAPPPRRESVKHLAALARILAPVLETPESSGSDTDSTGRELVGAAFRLVSPRLQQCVRDLRQKLTDLRRRPDSPVWLPQALAEIAPLVAQVAAISRSLAGIDAGSLEDELVEVGALLGKLRTGDVQVEIGNSVTSARVDPTLFGFALEILVDRARRQAGANRPVQIHCTSVGARLAWRVGVPGPIAMSPARGADPMLTLPARVLELHGSRLTVETDPTAGSWVLFEVAAG